MKIIIIANYSWYTFIKQTNISRIAINQNTCFLKEWKLLYIYRSTPTFFATILLQTEM